MRNLHYKEFIRLLITPSKSQSKHCRMRDVAHAIAGLGSRLIFCHLTCPPSCQAIALVTAEASCDGGRLLVNRGHPGGCQYVTGIPLDCRVSRACGILAMTIKRIQSIIGNRYRRRSPTFLISKIVTIENCYNRQSLPLHLNT